jgi:hypothetical protein
MSKPDVERVAGRINFAWGLEHMTASVSRARYSSDGEASAEVIFKQASGAHIHQCRLNLLSTRAQGSLANELMKRYELTSYNFTWEAALEQLCVLTLRWLRDGDPVVVLDTDKVMPVPEWVLEPVLPKNQPSLIFGLGASGKSYLALAMAACVSIPWTNNPLGWWPGKDPKRVLLLDYETEEDEATYRIKKLRKGMGLPAFKLWYLHCALPLRDDLDRVSQTVLDNKVDLVIIDSVTGAVGGNLLEAEPVLGYFMALRQLKTTTLSIGHTAKGVDPLQPARKKTPFGSVFFENFSRMIYETQRAGQEGGDEDISVGLFPRKSNNWALARPSGFRIVFDNNAESVTIHKQDLADVDDLAKSLSASARIVAEVKNGAKDISKIREVLDDLTDAAFRQGLHRLKKQEKIVYLTPQLIGLKAYDAN